jgi:ribosome-binding factor A
LAIPVAGRAFPPYVEGMAHKNLSSAKGPSQRQLRVGELIRRILSEVLSRGDVHDPDLNRFYITVGEVQMSADLRVATVHVMPLGGKDVEAAISLLAKHQGELRHHVSKGMVIKHVPELRFRRDITFDQLDETRRLLADARVQRDVAAASDDAPDSDA